MSKIILESPFSNKDQNVFNNNYFYLCLVARKLMIEEESSPLFFHALYTQFLNDNIEIERTLGINKSFEWHTHGNVKLYAIDRGVSAGMIAGGNDAIKKGIQVKFYTAMPNGEIKTSINEINAIEDNEERWNKGVAFVKSLTEKMKEKQKTELMPSEIDLGAITSYQLYNQDDIKNVKGCILSFFEPLVNACK